MPRSARSECSRASSTLRWMWSVAIFPSEFCQRSVGLDPKYGLARDVPVVQLRADLGEVAPAVHDEGGLQRPLGHERRQQRQIRGEAVFRLGSEVRKALNPGVRVLGKVTEID